MSKLTPNAEHYHKYIWNPDQDLKVCLCGAYIDRFSGKEVMPKEGGETDG